MFCFFQESYGINYDLAFLCLLGIESRPCVSQAHFLLLSWNPPCDLDTVNTIWSWENWSQETQFYGSFPALIGILQKDTQESQIVFSFWGTSCPSPTRPLCPSSPDTESHHRWVGCPFLMAAWKERKARGAPLLTPLTSRNSQAIGWNSCWAECLSIHFTFPFEVPGLLSKYRAPQDKYKNKSLYTPNWTAKYSC